MSFRFFDLRHDTKSFRDEALEGLRAPQKRVPPKYFYDERGSRLFEEICRVQEYYPTRTELGILKAHASEIASAIGRDAVVFEFGSGSGAKTRRLLKALETPLAYLPIDLSRDFLESSAKLISCEFPRLDVLAVCGDFTRPTDLMSIVSDFRNTPRAGFFPGSTIGNFEPSEARRFLESTAQLLGRRGKFLVGVDLVKDRATLEAAYNDSAGVTREFNLNLLRRMNLELAADFDLPSFEHRAFWNSDDSRIEMHLVSLRDQVVAVAGERFELETGETIHTESSYKYPTARFERLCESAGFSVAGSWFDGNRYFGVYLLEVS